MFTVRGLVLCGSRCYSEARGAPVRIFKTKWFSRFAMREGIADAKLVEAVQNLENGLVDADYGGGLIKQRLARSGEGKSSGYRSIVAFKSGTRSIFVFTFSKNVKKNLTAIEVREFKKAAAIYLKMTEDQISLAIRENELIEVEYHAQKI
jgi:hypothetical protein